MFWKLLQKWTALVFHRSMGHVAAKLCRQRRCDRSSPRLATLVRPYMGRASAKNGVGDKQDRSGTRDAGETRLAYFWLRLLSNWTFRSWQYHCHLRLCYPGMHLQKKHNGANIFPVALFIRKLLAGISKPTTRSLTFGNLWSLNYWLTLGQIWRNCCDRKFQGLCAVFFRNRS